VAGGALIQHPTSRAVLFAVVLAAAWLVLPPQAITAWQAAQPPTQTPAQTNVTPAPRMQPAPPGFQLFTKQTLHYEVEWRLWTAGNATLHLEPGAAGEQKLHATADSTGTVALLYHVHDSFDSAIDTRTFCSAHVSKHIEEGSRRVEANVRFDYSTHKATLQQANLKKGDTRQEQHDIPDCVSDVVSAIYYVGSLPLEVGKDYEFPLNDGGATLNVKVHVEAKEDVKTPAGTFHTLRVQPEDLRGILKSKGRVWVWYSDDASHIPVQMRSRLLWGTLTARLARVER